MKNLSKQLRSEVLKGKKETLQSINKIDFSEAKKLDWYLNNLLPAGKQKDVFNSVKELKEYLKKRLELRTSKKLESLEKQLSFNDNLQEIESLTINVEWKKSSMWGMNPTAEAYINGIGRVSSGSIGGCGYDKQSTAVANVLNQAPQFKKIMCELKNKLSNCKKQNRELFGYGSGYGIIPSFEGGVGVNCYDRIFNSIGYEFKTVSSGKNFDVYQINKVDKKTSKAKSKKLYSYSN